MDDIKERLIATEERAKSNTKRIDEHDKEINELKKTYSIMEKMDYRMQNVENNVSEIKTEIKKNQKSKKVWSGIYSSDSLRPNDDGHKVMVIKIANFIKQHSTFNFGRIV